MDRTEQKPRELPMASDSNSIPFKIIQNNCETRNTKFEFSKINSKKSKTNSKRIK